MRITRRNHLLIPWALPLQATLPVRFRWPSLKQTRHRSRLHFLQLVAQFLLLGREQIMRKSPLPLLPIVLFWADFQSQFLFRDQEQIGHRNHLQQSLHPLLSLQQQAHSQSPIPLLTLFEALVKKFSVLLEKQDFQVLMLEASKFEALLRLRFPQRRIKLQL